MGKKDKKSSKKLDHAIWKAIEKNEQEVKEGVSQFYDDFNGLVDISKQSPITEIVENIQKAPENQTLSVEQIQEKCLKVRENVIAGKSDNIEIDFIHGTQKFEGNEQPLGDTVFKAIETTTHIPIYSYNKRGEVKDVLVFIGGDDAKAFLAAKDDKGNAYFIELDEFHMLSVSENSKPGKEIGLMTSFNWLRAKIYSSIILAFNLDPVKNLLLGEASYAKAAEDEKKIGLEKDDTDDERV